MVTSNAGRYVPKDELIVVGGTLLGLFPYSYIPQHRISAQGDTIDSWANLWEESLHIGAFTHLRHIPP